MVEVVIDRQAVAILPSNLFEQFRLPSPVHRFPVLAGQFRVSNRLQGGPNQTRVGGPNENSEITSRSVTIRIWADKGPMSSAKAGKSGATPAAERLKCGQQGQGMGPAVLPGRWLSQIQPDLRSHGRVPP
jgi:hypothetical protein